MPNSLVTLIATVQGKALTCGRPERDGLEDVVRTADTSVNEQLELLVRELEPALLSELARDLREHLNTRTREVELPPAVVGEHDAGKTRIVGLECVLRKFW